MVRTGPLSFFFFFFLRLFPAAIVVIDASKKHNHLLRFELQRSGGINAAKDKRFPAFTSGSETL